VVPFLWRTVCLLRCADLSEDHQVLAVSVGKSVKLFCNTSLDSEVDWWYLNNPTASSHYVIASGYIQENYKEKKRFSLHSSKNEHSLIISDVRLNDTGLYICIEDSGLGGRHTFQLIVELIAKPTGKHCRLCVSRVFMKL